MVEPYAALSLLKGSRLSQPARYRFGGCIRSPSVQQNATGCVHVSHHCAACVNVLCTSQHFVWTRTEILAAAWVVLLGSKIPIHPSTHVFNNMQLVCLHFVFLSFFMYYFHICFKTGVSFLWVKVVATMANKMESEAFVTWRLFVIISLLYFPEERKVSLWDYHPACVCPLSALVPVDRFIRNLVQTLYHERLPEPRTI
jgi:hypothetical protein